MLSLPCLAFLSYWWIVPESVRWLITSGQYSQAKQQIQKVAEVNKVSLQEEDKVDRMIATSLADKEMEANKEKPSIIDLFRHRRICLRTLNLCFR